MTTNNRFVQNSEQYKFIAHRLGFLMAGYPENSPDNLETIFNNQELLDSVDGFEFDIQFTADHVPVVIHDINTADISEEEILLPTVNWDKLAGVKCGYRRSDYNSDLPWQENNNYQLQTLDSLLAYLYENKDKLGNKIIKMESKFPLLGKSELIVLKDLLDKYKAINDNITHISYFPWNLERLREIDTKHIKTEGLFDFKFERPFTKLWDSSIDGISLGIKNKRAKGTMKISCVAKFIAAVNEFFYEHRNAVSDDWLNDLIRKYGYASIHTISDMDDINELLKKVSPEFFDENASKLMITSDHPVYVKKLRK